MASLLFPILGALTPSQKTDLKEVTTTILNIYHLEDGNTLYLFEEGSAWVAKKYETTPLHWEEGDVVTMIDPYATISDMIEIENLSTDDTYSLQRIGKTTLIPHSIQSITPAKDNPKFNKHLKLKNAGSWLLFFEKETRRKKSPIDRWESKDRILVIVDPDVDWNEYPNQKGAYKFWWEFSFFNIDKHIMIDPPAHYFELRFVG